MTGSEHTRNLLLRGGGGRGSRPRARPREANTHGNRAVLSGSGIKDTGPRPAGQTGGIQQTHAGDADSALSLGQVTTRWRCDAAERAAPRRLPLQWRLFVLAALRRLQCSWSHFQATHLPTETPQCRVTYNPGRRALPLPSPSAEKMTRWPKANSIQIAHK